MGLLSDVQVRNKIEEFWQIMSGKSQARLEDLYSPSALVFTGKARAPESALQAIARRARSGETSPDDHAELGLVEIQIVGDVAVASYTYQFHQSRKNSAGGVVQRHTRHGRATQIFQLDERGIPRIVHEHLSAATNPENPKPAADPTASRA